jgi:hypothetical protein
VTRTQPLRDLDPVKALHPRICRGRFHAWRAAASRRTWPGALRGARRERGKLDSTEGFIMPRSARRNRGSVLGPTARRQHNRGNLRRPGPASDSYCDSRCGRGTLAHRSESALTSPQKARWARHCRHHLLLVSLAQLARPHSFKLQARLQKEQRRRRKQADILRRSRDIVHVHTMLFEVATNDVLRLAAHSNELDVQVRRLGSVPGPVEIENGVTSCGRKQQIAGDNGDGGVRHAGQ